MYQFDRVQATSRLASDPTKDPKVFKVFVEKGFQNNDEVTGNLMDPHWYWENHPNVPKHLSLKQAVTRLLSKNYYSSIADFITTNSENRGDVKLFLSLEAIHK